jgi:PhoH-like ATPase
MSNKTFVLDTNVLLHDPMSVFNFHEHAVVIPMTVLEELDDIKDRKKNVAAEARTAIRMVDEVLGQSTPEAIAQGVEIPVSLKGDSGIELGTLAIHRSPLADASAGRLDDIESNDNRIINCALEIQGRKGAEHQVVLVTKDINMRLKALGAGLDRVEDYRRDQLVSDVELLPSGHLELDLEFWSLVENVETWNEGHKTYHRVPRHIFSEEIYANQYLIDTTDEFAARVSQVEPESVVLLDIGRARLEDMEAWGVRPLNVYQGMAMHALLDPALDLNLLVGAAGSGKTLLSLACALELVVEQKRYAKIVVTRSTPPVAEDIGFLPGTEEEKMMPWLAAIHDNLEALHEHDDNPEASIRFALEKGNIQFKSLNFIRGRSIQDAIILLDESQNLTPQQLKTIITRCGKGSKIVCLGNLAQIDSNYLTALTSGLTYVVERFKGWTGASTQHLEGVVRSRLASYAEQNL